MTNTTNTHTDTCYQNGAEHYRCALKRIVFLEAMLALMTEHAKALGTTNSELRTERNVMAGECRRLDKELMEFKVMVAYIDAHVPLADDTCDEPGITFSEAIRREMQQPQAVQP